MVVFVFYLNLTGLVAPSEHTVGGASMFFGMMQTGTSAQKRKILMDVPKKAK